MSSPQSAPQPAPRPRIKAMIDEAPRCWRCGRRLADYVGRPWKLVCQRCRAANASQP
jgi:hypothetical protein